MVSLSKGFERGSLLRMTQLIRDELPGHPAAALTGPNLAKEIMAGPGRGQRHRHRGPGRGPGPAVGSCSGALFRIYINHDVIG